ncbi:carbohydrate esterase family 9 protein [Babjeviella inositovora NRRL Y-12698]|uniref:N-acetylglucosamine-6-phosphate deacetylase n=1 Tax=Babjeviella inositovora NRRL Y-12698 TaxID=984486 RepID=A0A1E3QJC4_9ASCO|nr:carbohydrate esterase family 9 protein [Babjeviella inositovora NRRL Y-12698]ODQ77554.1 carbohydrate esterase family 9 protein [Babjeviella inositovora NRRL Y-12698]
MLPAAKSFHPHTTLNLHLSNTMTHIIKLTNCSLCDEGLMQKKDLWVDAHRGVIINAPVGAIVYETVDMTGLVVAPGFIDVQINGAFGFDFSRSVTNENEVRLYVQDYEHAMRKYLSTGVTSICPTLTSSYPEVYRNVLPLVGNKRVSDQTESLGAHCEGPFISRDKKGCHPVDCLVTAPAKFKSMEEVYGADNFKNIAIITAAPEVEGVLETIPRLVESGVTVSIGHTTASYDLGVKAVQQGASMVTHMYNAMPQPHHRTPGIFGLLGMALDEESNEAHTTAEGPYFGLVADGVHLHHSAVSIAYHSAPDKCILVTDAMMLIGLPDGVYKWDDQKIVKSGKYLHLEGTDTIAGSSTDLSECLRNLMKWCDIDLATAVKTVTNHPAMSIGMGATKGFLRPGCDADLTILDKFGNVQQVYKLGRKVFMDSKIRSVL